jgi:hypothetical protein
VNHRDVQKRLVETKDLLASVARIDPDRRISKPKAGKVKADEEAAIQVLDDEQDPVAKLSRALNPPRMRGMNNRPKEELLERVYQESQVAEEEKGDMNKLDELWGEDVCIMAAPEDIRLALTGTRLPVSQEISNRLAD